MMARKPRMLVAVALANRMARIAWALMRNKEVYRDPAAAAATAWAEAAGLTSRM